MREEFCEEEKGGVIRVLVYKRTHIGDPDASGCFGVYDCMGTFRKREFDAVIGVGGISREAQSHSIDGKVNWIGIGPHKTNIENKRGPVVLFEHFLNFGTNGPDFRALAPQLAARMYDDNARSIFSGMSYIEQCEAKRIIRLAEDKPASPGLKTKSESTGTTKKCHSGRQTRRCVKRRRIV